MTVNATCHACDSAVEVEISLFGGEIDSQEPEACPACGTPLDDHQIERLVEEAVVDAHTSAAINRWETDQMYDSKR